MAQEIAECYSSVNSTLHIRPNFCCGYPRRMAGVREIRRAKLALLIKEHGTQKALAEAAGLAPAHVSQMNNGVREVGEEVARRIEEHLRLRAGWMDEAEMDSESLLTQEERDLLAAFRAVSKEAKEGVWDLIDGHIRRTNPALADKLGPRDLERQRSVEARLVIADKAAREKLLPKKRK